MNRRPTGGVSPEQGFVVRAWEVVLVRWAALTRIVLHRARADVPVVAAAWVLLLCATTLLSATVLYADVVAVGGLRQAVAAADPATRSIDVRLSAAPDSIAATDAIVRPQIAGALAAVGGPVVRVTRSDPLTAAGTDPATTKDLVVLSSLEGLSDHAHLTGGAWPAADAAPVEAALSDRAADALGLHVGDRVGLVDIRATTIRPELVIVGTWAPNDVGDAYWQANRLELDGTEPGAGFTSRGPFVVTDEDLLGGGITRGTTVEWRGLVPIDRLTPDSAARLGDDAAALRPRLVSALPRLTQATIGTGLPGLLDSLGAAIGVSRSSILLLTLQFAVVAAYAVLLVAGMLVERRRAEAALLRSRGASGTHLVTMAAAEAFVLAAPAVVLAPLLAIGVVRLVALVGPSSVGALVTEVGFGTLGGLAALPAVGAVAAGIGCVLALTAPTVAAAAGAAGIRVGLGRPVGRTLAQRAGLDIALVVVAALAIWQLQLYGAPLTRNARGVLGADPLLVAAPALALVAGSIVAIRLLPRLAEVAERVVARARGLVAPLGSRQLARRPLRYTRSSLLLVLAVALGTFAAAYGATWDRSQADQATYRAAADLRVVANDYPRLPSWAGTPVARSAPGVSDAVPVSRQSVGLGRTIPDATLLGVDAARVGSVAQLEPGDRSDLDAALGGLSAARPSPGVALPGSPQRIAVDLSADIELPGTPEDNPGAPPFATWQGIRVAAIVVDGTGRLSRLALGTTTLSAAHARLVAVLSLPDPHLSITPPLRVEAVEVSIEPPVYFPAEGTVDLEGLAVSGSDDGDDWTKVAFDPGASGWQWLRIDGSDTSDYRPPAGSPGRIVVGRSAPIFGSPDDAGPTFRLWDAASLGAPVPAIAGSRFLELAGLDVGSTTTLDSAGRELPVRIVGATTLFAPLDPATPFLVVDGPTLDAERFATTGDAVPITEWWLSVAPGQEDAAAAALSAAPFSAKDVVARAAVRQSLVSDPVSLGVIGALALGAIAALVFAAIGFVVNTTVSISERLGELAVLRALGVSWRQLVGWLVVESGVLLAVGLLGGIALGLLLAEVVLPFAALTASGAPPVPAPVVVVPLDALVPVYAAAILLLAASFVLAGRQVPAIHVGGVLRARDE